MKGTTSACAENTVFARNARVFPGNYLRVRGEYLPGACHTGLHQELPPRARRIRSHLCPAPHASGTTSACAENTLSQGCLGAILWNYLRVRGEYTFIDGESGDELELPPRARRILYPISTITIIGGTTSACAENTNSQTTPENHPRNYLRVRGEYEKPE